MGFFSKEHLAIAMTPRLLQQLIDEHCQLECVEGNVIEFTWEDIDLILVHDVIADRLRLMTPIATLEDLDNGQIEQAMKANFQSALDTRYAISDDMIWSVFLHPLSSLTEELFLSAVKQVATAKLTFGCDFSSGEYDF